MKRVLLTGAAGFIGRQCLPLLVEHGFEVHAADVRLPASPDKSARWHQADLLDRTAVSKLVSGINATHVLHLAWFAVPGRYLTAPENIEWVRASLELAKQFYDGGGYRFVGAGTCYEYDLTVGACSETATPLQPTTLYGASKAGAGMIIGAMAAQQKRSFAWGRIFHLYGPQEYPQRLIPSVINSLLAGQPARCTAGLQIRDYLHVGDVACGLVSILDSEVLGPVNIASGNAVTVKEVVNKIAGLMGKTELIRLGERATPAEEPPSARADIRRLKDEVGFAPLFDLEDGLKDAIAYWRAQQN